MCGTTRWLVLAAARGTAGSSTGSTQPGKRAGGASDDIYRRRADGTTPAELLVDRDEPVSQVVESDDGEWRVYRVGAGTSSDIYASRVGSDTVLEALLTEDYAEATPSLSPDGRWLAYTSNASGAPEVFVVPFPEVNTGRWQVSRDGGFLPFWSHSGLELFFFNPRSELEVVEIRPSSSFVMGQRRVQFSVAGYRFPTHGVDLTADDSTFVMIRNRDPGLTGQVIVVENFFEELKAKVGN